MTRELLDRRVVTGARLAGSTVFRFLQVELEVKSTMNDALIKWNQIFTGLFALIATVALAALIFTGVPVLAKTILPALWVTGGIALVFWFFVVVPFSFIRRFRPFSAISGLLVSCLFGATLWTQSLLLAFGAWGPGAVFLGLLFAGIGVVPIALAAMAFRGEWGFFGELLFLILLTWGSRYFAGRTWQREEDQVQREVIAEPQPQAVVAPPSRLAPLSTHDRQALEQALQEANQKAESQYTEKEKEILARHKRRPGRPACCRCGMTYSLDNIYICRECETYFCYRCVWNLEKINSPLNRWKCPCGGELW